jgi:hypothetical protein
MDQKNRIITWHEIMVNASVLANRIPHDRPVYLFSIPQNGAIVAGILACIRKGLILHLDSRKRTANGVCVIVDDIHDTGKTLNKLTKDANTFTATLYWRKKEVTNAPDFWAETVEDDAWLVFPWEQYKKE